MLSSLTTWRQEKVCVENREKKLTLETQSQTKGNTNVIQMLSEIKLHRLAKHRNICQL